MADHDNAKLQQKQPFDPQAYWTRRMTNRPDLSGAGSVAMPVSWQRWFYRGKKRAYRSLLRRHASVRGMSVLNFGCGTGFFEDWFESQGASDVAGVDFVEENIAPLRDTHPKRRYLCADLGRTPNALNAFGQFDLVTAIDVLYHVVDADVLVNVLGALATALKPDGWFLFTDILRDHAPAKHVVFRSRETWDELLGPHGIEIVDREPVTCVNNRPRGFSRRWPWLGGMLAHYADSIARKRKGANVNNWALLAHKVR